MSAPTGDPGGSVPTGDGAPKVPGEAYSFAVLRLVPRVERGERVNIGVVLHCRRHKFLGLELELDETRLRALDPNHLLSFRQGNTLPHDFALTGPVKHIDFICPEGYSINDTDEGEDAKAHGLGVLKRIMPVTDELDGHKFVTRIDGRRAATPLLAALVVIELTDVVGLDVSLNDDRCRVQSNSGIWMLGMFRRIAVSLCMEWRSTVRPAW